jgi:hypothetical protein
MTKAADRKSGGRYLDARLGRAYCIWTRWASRGALSLNVEEGMARFTLTEVKWVSR